jgi:iron complex outermembrane recepter protein
MKTNGINGSARLLCGAATFLALAATGAPVLAQDAEEPVAVEGQAEAQEGDIVVTGIRGSIQSSLNAKRDATSIVEVISSEDIGLLPDLSIADTLARLPGITAQRVRGRSQQISIRGLGPDFSLSLLNGREVVSAGNNRGIEFDQFPSELIGTGIVYKTGDARLAAIGIAGAVDLRTVKPLDSSKRQITLSGTYSINDSGSLNPDFGNDGYRFFGSYIDQNAAGTLGWSLGATVQSIPTQFISRELKVDERSNQIARTPGGVIFPRDNPRQGVVSRTFERASIAGSLQFEPTERFSLTIDGFYTDTNDSGIFRGTETPLASWATNGGAQVDEVTGSGPFATSATYSNVFPILRTDTEGAESKIFAIGGNLEWKANDNLGFVLDYGYSTLDRDDVDFESYAGTGFNGSGPADTLTFNFAPDGQYSIDGLIDYTDPANVLLTDPQGWGQVGFLREPEINDELHQLRAEAFWEFDGGFIDRITAGWLYTDRTKDFDNNGTFLRAGSSFVNGELAIPANLIIGQTNTGSLGQNIIAYDPAALLASGVYTLQRATDDTEWVVDEKVHNFYIQADINGDLGSVPVRGNIGLRYADTEQSSTGVITGGFTNNVVESFDNWLPSLNLSFEIIPDTFIRIAAARTITRARLDQLAANQTLNNGTGCDDANNDQVPDAVDGFNLPSSPCFTLSGGNPLLRPYQSDAFDISFEHYVSPGTAIILAGFYKDLSDWVVQISGVRDLTREIELAERDLLLGTNPEVAVGTFSLPTNFSNGSIFGVEGTLRVNFGDVADALDGFGGFYSITYSDAQIEPPGATPIPIPGYSDVTWSGDVFYEKNGFRAKLAARYRSGFLSEVQNFSGGLDGADAQGETIVDAQIGYTFEKPGSALNGVAVLAEVFNLTNEPFVTQNDLRNTSGQVVGAFPSRHELYGRTFQFTVRKSF